MTTTQLKTTNSIPIAFRPASNLIRPNFSDTARHIIKDRIYGDDRSGFFSPSIHIPQSSLSPTNNEKSDCPKTRRFEKFLPLFLTNVMNRKWTQEMMLTIFCLAPTGLMRQPCSYLLVVLGAIAYFFLCSCCVRN